MENRESLVNRRKKEPKPRRGLAQYWLRDERVLGQIVGAAESRDGDVVLEIGPGAGALTRRLLAEFEQVIAVEVDRNLVKVLGKEFGKNENFLLVEGDFLELNLGEYLNDISISRKLNKVVANIPYNITGPILERLLGKIATPNLNPYETIVLLVQKEVAERLVAKPGNRAFGALTVRVQYLAECEYISTVPAKAFYPAPKVDSAVVRLRPREIQPQANDPRWLENLVKVGFAAKRKMLRNNLKSLVDGELLAQVLEELEINPQARAEEISVVQWVELSNRLKAKL